MGPQDGLQWLIVLASMAITFVVMEIEKAIRRSLKTGGFDTDDEGPNMARCDRLTSSNFQTKFASARSWKKHSTNQVISLRIG